MKYICAQPATKYYAWQIDTMLHSFRTTGVNLDDVHIVCAIHGEIDPYFDKLMKKYTGVLFSFYEDTRYDKTYISSIRPHILKKHFKAFPDLEGETFFYHDCDIVFTKPLPLENIIDNDITYLSDTISYIGYSYIKSKGDDVLQKMLHIVGIDEATVKKNQENSGGAQYLIKGVDKYFWHDVEKDSTTLFKDITELNIEKKAKDPTHHEIQIWCADMWAVLWNIWKRNMETKVVKELDFSWSVTPIGEWHKRAIYHNAGVVNSSTGMFYKGDYLNDLPNLNLEISPKKCSYNYYKIIQSALI
jgi:hypothetical protein